MEAKVEPPKDSLFYQTIEIPGVGLMEGSWDHRAATDIYLGNVDFSGKTVIDVGPANGFFSFEMERRGASVTALDLGQEADWDAVPHRYIDQEALRANLRDNVSRVEKAFHFTKNCLQSRVELVYGTVYEVHRLIKPHKIALMSNVLQHFRDPFLAIQSVSQVVQETIIITESLWNDSPDFLNSTSMFLIPRAEYPEVNHTWWLVSPNLAMEILKLLGFPNLKCYFHEQKFNGSPSDPGARMVKHFTVTGQRPGVYLRRTHETFNVLQAEFRIGWYEEERSKDLAWRWSSQKKAFITIKAAFEESCRVNIAFGLGTSTSNNKVKVSLNGRPLWEGQVSYPTPVYLKEVQCNGGENILEIESSNPLLQPQTDSRLLGFIVYNFVVAQVEGPTSQSSEPKE